MRHLLTGLMFIIHFSAYSQNVIWREYIDDNNKDDIYPYTHTHKNNHYIFSMTENHEGSKATNDYVISMTKTSYDGELMWTKYYRPGGNPYRFFIINNFVFKDSIIVIYGVCNDTFSYDYKFICELSLDGDELFSNVYSLRSDDSKFHLSLTDSNTIDYVYDDDKLSKHAYVERYNKKHELIYIDSGLITYHPMAYRVHKGNIYTQDLLMTDQNKLAVKLFHHDLNWNIIDSAVLTTDIKMYPALTPLFHFSRCGDINENNEIAMWGVYNVNNTEFDVFYLKINVVTNELIESYYTRKNHSVKYAVHHNSLIYKEHENNTYALYRIYNKDSTEKYKFKLVKFKGGNEVWNVDFDTQSFLDIFSISVSMDFREDKILAVINYFNDNNQLGEWILEYDTNGNYIKSFYGIIDTNCYSMVSVKTFYHTNTELLSLYRMRLIGKDDGDLSWRKINFEPTGYTSITSTDINLYPNPAYKTITIDGIKDDNFSVEVFDLLGNRLLQKSNNSTIDIELLIKGIYILKVNTSTGMLVKKFIKE